MNNNRYNSSMLLDFIKIRALIIIRAVNAKQPQKSEQTSTIIYCNHQNSENTSQCCQYKKIFILKWPGIVSPFHFVHKDDAKEKCVSLYPPKYLIGIRCLFGTIT